MSIRNKVQLVGHVGMNPEIKTWGNDGKLAKFSLAINESYKNSQGNWIENTTWLNLLAWRKIADRIEKTVTKGSYLLVEGKIVKNQYKDKDGITRYATDIDVSSFMVLDSKSTENDDSLYEKNAQKKDEDLPF